MNIDTLKLNRYFYTTLDYNELKNRLKDQIGINYKLGLIDNEEISLYYRRDGYTDKGLDRVPSCQIELKNKKEKDGRIKIKFSIAGVALIGIASIPIIFMLIIYFKEAPVPFYNALGLYPILYLVLQYILSDQSDKFEWDLKQMESKN